MKRKTSSVTLSDIGEFELIDRLVGIIHKRTDYDMLLTVGSDDAAVWRFGSEYIIATTDTMVEGVHFTRDTMRWSDVGWKALASNVSDIAAMGGRAEFALVNLAIPAETTVDVPEQIYRGLQTGWMSTGVSIAGGDIVRAPNISISITAIGKAAVRDGQPMLLRRDRAREGDVVAVTGTLGDAAAGLLRVQAGAVWNDKLVQRHIRPRARQESGIHAVGYGIECGLDVSDGLIQDIGHVCRRSGVGAVLHAAKIPLSKALREAYPDKALQLACTGGEDYELVLVGEMDRIKGLGKFVDDVRLTVIGEIVADRSKRVRLLDDDGLEVQFDPPGWDAFRP